MTAEDAPKVSSLLQWSIGQSIVVNRYLTLHEAHCVLSFETPNPPGSLASWQKRCDYLPQDRQRAEQINRLTKGLIEMRSDHIPDGEEPALRIIHSTVVNFFNRQVESSFMDKPLGRCVHQFCYSVMISTCINFLSVDELNEICENADPMVNLSQLDSLFARFP